MDAWLKAFLLKLNTGAKELWEKDKVFVIVFGLLILIVKFKDVLISLLVASAKRTVEDAQKKDATLATQESQANTQADALVQKAKDEASKETPVGTDWHKKNE